MSKINLLLCSHQSRKEFIGGAELLLLELARHLPREKFNVFFLANEKGRVDEMAKRSGNQVQVIPYGMFWEFLAPGKTILSDWEDFLSAQSGNIEAIQTYIVQNRIDVVISNCVVNIAPLIAAKELKIPSIWLIHEIIYAFENIVNRLKKVSLRIFQKSRERQKSYALSKLREIILEYSGKAIFPSENARNRVFQPDEYRDRILVHYPPIRRDVYEASHSAETSSLMNHDAPLHVSFLGILVKHKGVHDFIKAANYVLKEIPHAIFTISGGSPDPSYLAYLNRLVRNLKLEGRITFTGFLENPLPVYDSTDIICLTSLYDEPFGMVVSEGMIRAKVVIAYETGSIREIIDDGYNGFIVPRAHPRALAEKIIFLAKNKSIMKDIGQNARLTASERFDPGKYFLKMQRLVEEAIGPK